VSARQVILWRHGRTASNLNGTWQGQSDVPLDEIGFDQAGRAAKVLATLGEGEEPLRIISSDLHRASDTAQALADLLEVRVYLDSRLREIDAGKWQGRTREEIIDAGMGNELQAWLRGDDVRCGGGERRMEAGRRGAEVVAEFAREMDGGTLVAVGHGGVLRGTILTLLGLPPGQWGLLVGLGNAHWAVLRPRETGWQLQAYDLGAPEG
jgi:glucosyl-3-phosphoglycerate phosphatase